MNRYLLARIVLNNNHEVINTKVDGDSVTDEFYDNTDDDPTNDKEFTGFKVGESVYTNVSYDNQDNGLNVAEPNQVAEQVDNYETGDNHANDAETPGNSVATNVVENTQVLPVANNEAEAVVVSNAQSAQEHEASSNPKAAHAVTQGVHRVTTKKKASSLRSNARLRHNLIAFGENETPARSNKRKQQRTNNTQKIAKKAHAKNTNRSSVPLVVALAAIATLGLGLGAGATIMSGKFPTPKKSSIS